MSSSHYLNSTSFDSTIIAFKHNELCFHVPYCYWKTTESGETAIEICKNFHNFITERFQEKPVFYFDPCVISSLLVVPSKSKCPKDTQTKIFDFLCSTNHDKIISLINSLPYCTLCGPDGIASILQKYTACSIAYLFMLVFFFLVLSQTLGNILTSYQYPNPCHHHLPF